MNLLGKGELWLSISLSLLAVTCCLLITFANSLDPDQDRLNICPNLDPNHLTLIVILKETFEKCNFEKSADDNQGMRNYPACKELTDVGVFFDSVSYNNVYSVYCDHRVNYQMSLYHMSCLGV